MIDMRVGLLADSFKSMDGEVVNVEFKSGQVPLEASDFDGATGDRLQREYQLLPHALAKESAVKIPAGAEGEGKHDKAGKRGSPSDVTSANPVWLRRQAESVWSLFH
jgi:hypothetical protein